jgi:hypothetical protein
MQARARPALQDLTAKDQDPCSIAGLVTYPLEARQLARPPQPVSMRVLMEQVPQAARQETGTGVWPVTSRPEAARPVITVQVEPKQSAPRAVTALLAAPLKALLEAAMCRTRQDSGTRNHALQGMSAQLGPGRHRARSAQEAGLSRVHLMLRQMLAPTDTHVQGVQLAHTERHAHSDNTL